MSIKKLKNFFKKAPIEEVTEKLKDVDVEFVPNEKEEKKECPEELKKLDALLKALNKQLEVNKFDKLPKDDYIRSRVSKEEKEYLKQFCIDNSIQGGISELIRISVHSFVYRKELENGKK